TGSLRGSRRTHGSASPLSSLHPHHRDDRHAWTERIVGVWGCIEDDLDWNALHDFDKVTGSVLGWEETKTRSRTRLPAVNVPHKHFAGIGINLDLHGLPWSHMRELRLHEVRDDPDVVGHNGQHRLADLDIRSGFHGFAGYPPGFRRIELGRGEFKLGML